MHDGEFFFHGVRKILKKLEKSMKNQEMTQGYKNINKYTH